MTLTELIQKYREQDPEVRRIVARWVIELQTAYGEDWPRYVDTETVKSLLTHSALPLVPGKQEQAE